MKKIYTIGYEGKTQEEFLKILSEKGIRHLADVRTSPSSKRSEFSGDNLKKYLFTKGIFYKHMPDLGGLETEDYSETINSISWKNAFQELEVFADEAPTVMMCMEKEPSRCHRRFISNELEKNGWDVIHLGRGGSWRERTLDDFTDSAE